MKTPAVVSFSVKDENLAILEQFNKIIQKGDLNRSAVFLRLMKEYINGSGRSNVEKMFINYCTENHLDVDAQLMLLLGPYRVSNNGMEPVNKKEEDFPMFGQENADKLKESK